VITDTITEEARDLFRQMQGEIAHLRINNARLRDENFDLRNQLVKKTRTLEFVQGAVHLLRKAIHARDPVNELDFRCHEIWTEIERATAQTDENGT